MGRAIALIAAAAAAMMTAEPAKADFWNAITFGMFSSGPCGGQRGHVHGNGGGFVADGAYVQSSAQIDRGAEVCAGSIVGPSVHLGRDARLTGNVVVRDHSTVNSEVCGNVTIINSRVDTSERVCAVGAAAKITIGNSIVTDDAKLTYRATINDGRLIRGFDNRGRSIEICHTGPTGLTGPRPGGVIGENCDEMATPLAEADYDQPWRPANTERFGQAYQPAWMQPYGNSCGQQQFDYRSQSWSCGGGMRDNVAPGPAPYASNDWMYYRIADNRYVRYVQVQGGVVVVDRASDLYEAAASRQDWSIYAQYMPQTQPTYGYPNGGYAQPAPGYGAYGNSPQAVY